MKWKIRWAWKLQIPKKILHRAGMMVFGTGVFLSVWLGLCQKPVYAYVQGTGSLEDPLTGKLAVGDQLDPDRYVRNLTETNQAVIILEGIYQPKQYVLDFDAGEGRFSDEEQRKELPAVYGEILPAFPSAPRRDAFSFMGWYLKGNKTPAVGGLPQDKAGGCILWNDTVFMLAADDPEDAEGACLDENGHPVAAAIWRSEERPQDPLYDADVPDAFEASRDRSLWDPLHANNYVIAFLEDAPDRESYRRQHGQTAYPYGRVSFTAATGFATAYHWYLQKPGEKQYEELSCTEPVWYFDRPTAADNQSHVRCVVEIGDRGDQLSYDTILTVYSLPEIVATKIYAKSKEAA